MFNCQVTVRNGEGEIVHREMIEVAYANVVDVCPGWTYDSECQYVFTDDVGWTVEAQF